MILFATQNFLPAIGGTQLYLTGLADALAARGHDIAVYCDTANREAAAPVDSIRKYSIRRFGGLRPLMRRHKARALAKRLAGGGVTAIITDTWKSLEHLSLETLHGVHVLCLAHGSEFLVSPGSLKERRMVECLGKADIIGANSRFTADMVRPFVHGKTDVKLLLPGIGPPVGASRALHPRESSVDPRLLTIARLEPRKGIDAVLHALPALAVAHPTISYDVVGKGNDRERLISLANQLRLTDRVHFRGYVAEEEKADLLRKATLFVLPNRREPGSVEGFGMVFVEAAAFGVPSIAGADGGTSDAVLSERTGLILDGANESAVRIGISRLVSNQATRRSMGEAAHRRFWEEFAWSAAVHRFEAALRRN